MTIKTPSTKTCVHCDPNTPHKRSIIEPICLLSRSEVLRLVTSRAKDNPLALTFRCRMCDRTWAHRVDVRILGATR